MSLENKIRHYMHQLAQQGLLRTRQMLRSEHSSFIHFDSNDYLSLAGDKGISEAYQRGYTLYPAGSGASMLLSGYHPNHHALEQAFAELLSVDECILFSSGYAANLAVTALLGKLKAYCFIDKEIHASVYDGLALSQVSYTRYIHNDLSDLTHKLNAYCDDSVLMTEGIFSMSGHKAPLDSMAALCQAKQTALLVDEAHSFGVLGSQGRGAVACYGLTQQEVALRIIPLGKAFAAQGALVAGRADWIQALLQTGRSLIYSTAMSPALSYGLFKTLDFVVNAEDRRLKLAQLVDFFRELVKKSFLKWSDSNSPIQLLQLGCPHKALYYSLELKKHGISCLPVRKPSVTTAASGLRIVLNYAHTPEQIIKLFNLIEDISTAESQQHPIIIQNPWGRGVSFSKTQELDTVGVVTN